MPGPIPPIPHGESVAPSPLLRKGGEAPPPEPWVSNRDGNFSVGPVTPGRVRAIVRHPGYVEGSSDLVTLAAGGIAHVHVVLHSSTLTAEEEDQAREAGAAAVILKSIRGENLLQALAVFIDR